MRPVADSTVMSFWRRFFLLAVLSVGPVCEKPVPGAAELVTRAPATTASESQASAEDAASTENSPDEPSASPMMQLACERVRQTLEEASALPKPEVVGAQQIGRAHV